MKIDVQRTIPANHPSLAGHFPGRPIVPGVVILDEVFSALRESFGPSRLIGVPMVKFLRPLNSQQPFTISLSRRKDGTVEFNCSANEHAIAQGRFVVDRVEK